MSTKEKFPRSFLHRIMPASGWPIPPRYRRLIVVVLFVDVILCIALLALAIRHQVDFTITGINCPHLQYTEGVLGIDEHCVTTVSKSNDDILNQMVETRMKNKIEEKVHQDDIPINMRPHGLLKGVIMEPGSYEYTSKAQTIETWREEKSGYSELDFGVRMRHGRLVVPRSGLYQVFSHIYFSEDTDSRKSNNTELEHKMYKFNILHEDSGEGELLQAGLTPCLQSQKWQSQEENAGSYAGAIAHLQAGDEISVRVTYIHFLEGCKGEHYFGLHKIGS